jgi:hypothetical protein
MLFLWSWGLQTFWPSFLHLSESSYVCSIIVFNGRNRGKYIYLKKIIFSIGKKEKLGVYSFTYIHKSITSPLLGSIYKVLATERHSLAHKL